MKKPSVSKRTIFVVLCYVAVFLLLVLIVVFAYVTRPKSEAFSAVFLDNGQVYFGKIIEKSQDELILNHVFYLKASTDLSTKSTKDLPNANLALVKLGQEIYKPRDKMIINRDHILFIEEMSPNSEIMSAIEKYENQTK